MDMPIDFQHQAMGYDRTATMFSPEGKLLQVEYAEKAVKWGSASIGMVCNDGVFILADKRLEEPLLAPKSTSKIYEIDSHIIASSAGIVADARVLVERAQVLSQQHRVTYDSPIEPESVIKDISNMKQQFTQYGGARPFGVTIMVAGVNKGRAELYGSDVTGNYFSYMANAIGENDEKIKEKLRTEYKKDLTIRKGAKIAANIFKEIQEGKFNLERFELAFIKKDSIKIERLDGEELKNFLK
ncbi:archaeal proteasome endopeptidase complex subunit alpha [Candidatus Pacearchaeota archaeon]|nr:archaeal proteasome endopeptidase complex subunit alpha [Candidatus Pacearchaeota archaeon]